MARPVRGAGGDAGVLLGRVDQGGGLAAGRVDPPRELIVQAQADAGRHDQERHHHDQDLEVGRRALADRRHLAGLEDGHRPRVVDRQRTDRPDHPGDERLVDPRAVGAEGRAVVAGGGVPPGRSRGDRDHRDDAGVAVARRGLGTGPPVQHGQDIGVAGQAERVGVGPERPQGLDAVRHAGDGAALEGLELGRGHPTRMPPRAATGRPACGHGGALARCPGRSPRSPGLHRWRGLRHDRAPRTPSVRQRMTHRLYLVPGLSWLRGPRRRGCGHPGWLSGWRSEEVDGRDGPDPHLDLADDEGLADRAPSTGCRTSRSGCRPSRSSRWPGPGRAWSRL